MRTYVLISVTGASSSARVPYSKMKGELEDAVKALGFEQTVLVKPGLIVGTRRNEDSRPAEFVIRKVAGAAGMVSNGLKDFWAQDADVIARAAIMAGLECQDGRRTEKGVWEVGGKDIVRLGKTEWKE